MQTQHEFYVPQNESSPCDFFNFGIVWGRNFVADAELVSVMAGVYGILQPQSGDMFDFIRQGTLAALFALGTVEERPSVEQVIRPRINLVYLIFMLLPFALSLVLLFQACRTRRRCLPIPQSVWQLMIQAKDEPLIPRLRDCHNTQDDGSPFPPQDSDLVYVFYNARETLDDVRGNLEANADELSPKSCIIRRSQLAGHDAIKDGIEEFPVDDESDDGVIMVTDTWKDEGGQEQGNLIDPTGHESQSSTSSRCRSESENSYDI